MCEKGPVIRVGDKVIEGCTLEKAALAIEEERQKVSGDKTVNSVQ